jgi:hypothetical protein
LLLWDEFAKKVQSVPKGTDDVITLAGDAMDMLDATFYNSTPDRKKLENCILVAANAFRLYKHYKSTA